MEACKEKVKVSNDVLFGGSGYLYLWMGRQEQFSYLSGEKRVSLLSENNFKDNIANRAQYLSGKGITYAHVVFPSKPLVKKSFLPAGLCVESLYLNFPENSSVFYPLHQLIEFEKAVSTFRKLDTHMTDSGSLCVVQGLIDKLDTELFEKAVFKSESKLVSGDLARMLGSLEKSNEHYLKPIKHDGVDFYFKSFNNHNALVGNSGRVTVQHCVNSLTDKRLIVFGDSFFQAMLHLLAPFFKDILFVRTAFFYKELVELFKPDVVYSGNAERYLKSIPSDKESGFFFFQESYQNSYKPDSKFLNALAMQLSHGFNDHEYNSWSRNLEASLLNEHANYLLSNKNYADASHLLKMALDIKPNNVALKEKLASCLRYL